MTDARGMTVSRAVQTSAQRAEFPQPGEDAVYAREFAADVDSEGRWRPDANGS
jgi:hypothetical protein